MELTLGEDLDEFRSELRSWLKAKTPAGLTEADWSRGMGEDQLKKMTAARQSALYKEWEALLLEERLICAQWPVEVGGRNMSARQLMVFGEEFQRAGVPHIHRGMGEGLSGPSIIVHGTEEQKAYFLPRIIDGTDDYCQGFSEPDHGSDLAAVDTRGVVDGDEIVVSGRKVWTSGVTDHTNMMFCLCRTDPSQPRHQGLSYVLIPFKNNGFDVRPIKQMSGGSNFCEEFIDGARAPLFNVIGGLGNGWRVAMTTLGNERGGGVSLQRMGYDKEWWNLVEDVRRLGKEKDSVVRQDLAWSYEQVQIMRVAGKEQMAAITTGRPVGRGAIGSKLRWSEYHKRFGEIAVNILGPEALIRPEGEGYPVNAWQGTFLHSRAGTIYAGTSQIQRNIISERALGMPKEPSAKKS
jgi:alkylation response protein AidB-like acyl-CoA dehydrogenase